MHFKHRHAALLSLVLLLCAVPMLAHAAADPVATAGAVADTSWSLVAQYGPLWALALIIQGAGQTFLARQHWLAQGRTLALISGGVGTLGAVLAWHFNGAPAAGIAVTAVMAIKLAWSPGVRGATPQPSGARASASTAAMLAVVLLAIGAAGSLTACTKAELGAAATGAEHALINCTGSAIGTTPALNVATLTALANEVAELKAKCTIDGSFDWSCAEQAAIGEGEVLGGCSLVQLLTSSSSAPAAAAHVRTAATVPPDPGRVMFEDFRTKVAGGATYHTSSGNY